MFKTLKHNKDVIATNIENYIPNNVTSVLRINKQKDLPLFDNFINIFDSIFTKINDTDLTYPLYLINDKQNTTLLVRVTTTQEKVLKEKFLKLFSDFPAKNKSYKNINIYFYLTSDNRFYCCMFYKGIFAGGYNYKLLEQIIDTQEYNSFFDLPSVKPHLDKANKLYNANFYTLYNDSLIIFNILANKSDLIIEGFANTYIKTDTTAIQTKQDTVKQDINYKIFPNNLITFDINDSNQSIISNNIIQHFKKPYYTFYLENDLENPIYALKHKENKFKVYNLLNNLEVKYTGRKFNINDFVANKQRVYTASIRLSNDIFEKDTTVTFTFYKDFLIYSNNRNSLIQYLNNNGHYMKPDSNLTQKISTNRKKNTISGYLDKSNSNSLRNIYNLETLFNGENLYLYGNITQQDSDVQINIILTKFK